jgi:hypothetical protein
MPMSDKRRENSPQKKTEPRIYNNNKAIDRLGDVSLYIRKGGGEEKGGEKILCIIGGICRRGDYIKGGALRMKNLERK